MSEYAIGEVAKVAQVTVRTLHHYDRIGLLSPSGRTPAGYRIYRDADLDRLQRILFYRELGFPSKRSQPSSTTGAPAPPNTCAASTSCCAPGSVGWRSWQRPSNTPWRQRRWAFS